MVNDMAEQNSASKRLSVFRKGVYAVMVLLIVRLVDIQLLDREGFKLRGEKQYKCPIKLFPERGRILDRNGELLAFNVPAVDVFADPQEVDSHREAAARLAPVLGESQSRLLELLTSHDQFVYLSRNRSRQIYDRVQDLGIMGVYCQKVTKRKYPKEHVAAQIIGFTDIDNRGLSGIELTYDEQLAGVPGKAILMRTGTAEKFYHAEYPVFPPENGRDVVLTIDYFYQKIAQDELYKRVVETESECGVVVILDRNAEILAMASEPHFNPNRAGHYHPSTWRMRAITDQYEMGSTMKVAVMAAYLDQGTQNPYDLVFCENGRCRLYDRTIHDTKPHGWLTLRDVLIKSSNIGMAKTMMDYNQERLYEYINAFGFGVRTGVELVGEVPGVLRHPYEWSRFTPIAMSYGYEIAVTPLQMAAMYNVIANDGLLMRPTILREFKGKEKLVENIAARQVRHVIKKTTADTLKAIMGEVVKSGTGIKARLDGVNACGKTGTARAIRDDGTGYEKNKYIATFGGFFPQHDPEITIFVLLKNPRAGSYYGGDAAAPLFQRIGNKIIEKEGLDYFDSVDRRQLPAEENMAKKRVPNLVGFRKPVAMKLARKENLNVKTVGSGKTVVAQQPEAGRVIDGDQNLVIVTEKQSGPQSLYSVPYVVGLPLRNAINILAARNIRAVVDGSGRVVRQQPKAGQKIKSHEQVMLHCESSIDVGKLLAL